MSGALTRYRVIAYVVGVILVVLVLLGVPLKYLADQPTVVSIVGPLHGFLYLVYLVAVFDLGRRARWPIGRMLLVMLAGTIPFLTFWVERRVVTRWMRTPEAAVGAS
jgi:integral membrane protein